MGQLLITGGAGFIGSHTCLKLLQEGHSLLVFDDFSNGSNEALKRVAELANVDIGSQLKIFKGDIRSRRDLDDAFSSLGEKVEAVIHFAGLKAVGESILNPLNYWDVNVGGSRNLLEGMLRNNCRTIVFSSSATIYGSTQTIPIAENSKIQPTNPYGRTKEAIEQLLFDVFSSGSDLRVACLRYFNPVGAHPSGLIGEAPSGKPNNLFPFVSQVAVGVQSHLEIFGTDWPTHDGSAIRDYIHVMDLAEGHSAALKVLQAESSPQLITLNLGSGKGYSVFEVLGCFENFLGKKIPYIVGPRRPGDVSTSIADPSLAETILQWKAKRNLEDMCRDALLWQKTNPFGYGKN